KLLFHKQNQNSMLHLELITAQVYNLYQECCTNQITLVRFVLLIKRSCYPLDYYIIPTYDLTSLLVDNYSDNMPTTPCSSHVAVLLKMAIPLYLRGFHYFPHLTYQ